jgi:hypothetical protein
LRASIPEDFSMKRTILAAAFVLAPFFAQAETLKFPSEAPIASVKIPNDWEPKETESGVDATSPDAAIYFSIDDAIKFLTDNGVEIDASTKSDSGDVEINGMQFGSIEFDGKDKDGPVEVSLGFASPRDGKMLVVTYWGTKATQDAHHSELVGILQSLKPVK